jgi:hypothetical protein
LSLPNTARVDIPSLLQHIIAYGIEQWDIFQGDNDHQLFLKMLSKLLVETDTDCLALPLGSHVQLRWSSRGFNDFRWTCQGC